MALTFAKVFKLMNDEYGVQSSDGENVLNALRANKENEFFEEETQDCTPSYSSSSKRKERDEQSEDDDNIDIDVMVQIMEERILSDSEVIEDALNDLLNKVEQNIDKKYDKPIKKRRVSLQEKLELHKKKHPMLKPCVPVSSGSKKGCNKKCTESIDEDLRREIYDYYWSLNKDKQNIWISLMVETVAPVRPRKNTQGKKERKCARVYYLENRNKERIKVCQKMFLATLGLTTDKTVQTVMSKAQGSRTSDVSNKRGKKQTGNKKPDDVSEKVNAHIMSFNPSISHYRRKHAPNRLYISPEFNVSMMFKEFRGKYPDIEISYTYYYTKVKRLNISFVKLGEEECEKCDLHDRHLEEVHGLDKSDINGSTGQKKLNKQQADKSSSNDSSDLDKSNKKQTFVDCSSCQEFEMHIKAAKEARSRYREEATRKWNDNETVVSVDMQKVIMLPRIPGLKEVVFCKRIVVLNETFAPVGGPKMGKERKPTGVLWHEGIKGRNAPDVASTYISFIRSNRDINDFVFWVDNCSGQNKNWYLFTALANEVNINEKNAKTIILKYFEPGHTFMSADSFHHKVELAMRQKKRVEDFQDFVDIVNNCGRALVMSFDDFFEFPKGVSQAKYAQNKPKLEDVQVVKFARGSNQIYWKNDHRDNNFKSSRFLQKKYEKSIEKEFSRNTENRGVKPSKNENIIKVLCPHMKERSRPFWNALHVNDASVDLISERDDCDEED